MMPKKILGKINTTKRYAVLVYLKENSPNDAQGGGALEHNSSTSATFDDNIEADGLDHTISHEFFHTLTPYMCIRKKFNFGILISQRCLNTYGCMRGLQSIFLYYLKPINT
ncbi:MAG: hypothetical protein U5K51_14500 [Flavobacteriaceae bacterium]|nr:hypothetical protein [Flavobacteriaceae bacterium]